MRVSLHPFLQQCLVFDIISFRESDWHDIKNQILFRTKNINWSGAKLKINLPLGKNQYRILSFLKKKKKETFLDIVVARQIRKNENYPDHKGIHSSNPSGARFPFHRREQGTD